MGRAAITTPRSASVDSATAAAKRLKELRATRYATANEAADAMGCNRNTYHQHESGVRPITRKAAVFYSHHFNVAAGEILFGERLQPPAMVLIVGTLQHGAWVTPEVGSHSASVHAPTLVQWFSRAGWKKPAMPDRHGEARRYTDAPPGMTAAQANRVAAVTIQDDALFPAFIKNDTVYYDPTHKGEVKPRMRCVVLTDAGQLAVGIAEAVTFRNITLAACGDQPQRILTGIAGCWPVFWIRHSEAS